MEIKDIERLIKYLGECPHKYEKAPWCVSSYYRYCDYCGIAEKFNTRRGFSASSPLVWLDFGALRKRLEKKGDWEEFIRHALIRHLEENIEKYELQTVYDYTVDSYGWLTNPGKFFMLVSDFLRAREANENKDI